MTRILLLMATPRLGNLLSGVPGPPEKSGGAPDFERRRLNNDLPT
jgi:hypothetical protein